MENDAASPMHHPYHSHVDQGHGKHGPKQTTTIKPLKDEVAFRIVCHVSVVGGLIGRSGGVISRIFRENKCRIHCEDAVPGSIHRVIVVIGSGAIDRRIVFHENNVREEFGEVSRVQEAVIRVFERMWELEAQIEGESESAAEDDDVAYCGLLANTTHIGVVVGRGGKNVMRMRKKSGAKIRMLPPPICAAKDDELIQITGGTLAVKKALVAVTACLQDWPPIGKPLTLLNGLIEKVDYRDSPNLHAQFFPRLPLESPLIGNSENASAFHSSWAYADTKGSLDTKGRQQEVAFRLLVSDRAAAGIIGRRGAIVKSLQNVSGALISFAAPLTKSHERVVTISALEDLDTQYSPVQNAIILVFARSVEVEGQKGFSSGVTEGARVTARLLVGADFVGCLIGNGSRVVSEITDIIDADIQLLGGEQILDSATQNDVLVQISGAYKNVKNALFEVTSRLRQNLRSSEVVNKPRLRSPDGRIGETNPPEFIRSAALSPDSKQETIARRGVDQLCLPLTRSKQLHVKTKGRRQATPATDDKPGSRTLGMSLELEKTLVHLLPTEVLDEVEAKSPSAGVQETTCSILQQPLGQSLDSGQQYSLMEGMAQLGLGGPSILQPSKTDGRGHSKATTDDERGHSKATTDDERGSTIFAEGVELESGNNSVFVANTTLNIVVGEHIFGLVYGQDGRNLARLKEISGAEIEVCKPCLGKSKGMVVISGTPDQTRLAHHVLQVFVEDGQ